MRCKKKKSGVGTQSRLCKWESTLDRETQHQQGSFVLTQRRGGSQELGSELQTQGHEPEVVQKHHLNVKNKYSERSF